MVAQSAPLHVYGQVAAAHVIATGVPGTHVRGTAAMLGTAAPAHGAVSAAPARAEKDGAVHAALPTPLHWTVHVRTWHVTVYGAAPSHPVTAAGVVIEATPSSQ